MVRLSSGHTASKNDSAELALAKQCCMLAASAQAVRLSVFLPVLQPVLVLEHVKEYVYHPQ